MVRCKARELLRSEAYMEYVAATKDSCNAAEDRFPTASWEGTMTTAVLGVGNLLRGDDGLGVHVIRRLEAAYRFPAQVRLLDGGSLGERLLYWLEGCRRIVVVDAIQAGGRPGALYRLDLAEALCRMHATRRLPASGAVLDVLAAFALAGDSPEVVVLGMEPLHLRFWDVRLSPELEARLPALVEAVLALLGSWGFGADPAGAGSLPSGAEPWAGASTNPAPPNGKERP